MGLPNRSPSTVPAAALSIAQWRGGLAVPDIFVSHKAEERGAAKRLVRRLAELGYDVWSAAELVAGEHFEAEITARLDTARAVIVLWSHKAVASEWVRAEAETARRRGIALPVVIDDVPIDRLPLLFRTMHISDLSAWNGGKTHAGYRQLLSALVELVGEPGAVAPAPPPPADTRLNQPTPQPDVAHEDELWEEITQNPSQSAEEYRNYLTKFGEEARFADLARLRIRRLEKEVAHRRWNWGYLGSILVALATLVGSVFAFVQWVGENPDAARWATSFLVTEEQRQASALCSAWLSQQATEPQTNLPVVETRAVAACEVAAATFGASADIKATLGLAYLARDAANDEKARQLIEDAGRSGSPVAHLALGLMYLYGWVYQPDLIRATEQLKRAGDAGLAHADGILCDIGNNLRGSLPGQSVGHETFCRRGSDKGDALAQRGLGYLRMYGFVGRRDIEEATRLFEAAVAHADAGAQYYLALLHLRGEGVPADPAKALELLDRASGQGFARAERQIGLIYECGLGVEVDIAEAARHYENAFGGGDNVAAYLTGSFFAEGRNSEFGPEAQDTIDISNIPNCDAATRLMAFRLGAGHTIAPEPARAMTLFEAATASGNGISLYVLATVINAGVLTARDPARIFALQQQAAATGVLYGQFGLGVAYQLGIGTAVNLDEAARYFRLARDQGHPDAAERLLQMGR